jgi:glycerophosphoryl diester phosphodiesterase
MVDRRSFLSSGFLMAGLPLLDGKHRDTVTGSAANNSEEPSFFNRLRPRPGETYFISHRGVHLKQRAAGENTIESLRLAKRTGFQCVEFDVRFTSDGRAVVIHDETINRTLRDHQGNKPSTPVYVKDLTFEKLRTGYTVFTENKKAKAIVPSLEEYLAACRLYKVIPFVEIKDHAITRSQYDALVHSLDTIIGRENYVITSNNKVNDQLRVFGYKDIVVMGILYQTTFDHIQHWDNSIMAISASRFSPAQMQEHVRRANQHRIPTESHADAIDSYNQIIRNGIDFISTDALMPEHTGQGQVIVLRDFDDEEINELHTNGRIEDAAIVLQAGQKLEINIDQYQNLSLYGVTLELEFSGECQFRWRDQKVLIGTKDKEYFRYPVLLHKEPYRLHLIATNEATITSLRITVTKF